MRPALTCPHCGKEIRKATGNTISVRQYAEKIGLKVPEGERFDDAFLRPNARVPTATDPWFYMNNAGNRRYRFWDSGPVYRWINKQWQETPAYHVPTVIQLFREILEFNTNRKAGTHEDRN